MMCHMYKVFTVLFKENRNIIFLFFLYIQLDILCVFMKMINIETDKEKTVKCVKRRNKRERGICSLTPSTGH